MNQEKVRLMTRLAILEKHSGKRIRKAESTSRIDLIANPVWKSVFLAWLVFLAAAVCLGLLNLNMILNSVAGGSIGNLIMIVMIMMIMVLVVTAAVSFAASYRRYQKTRSLQYAYHSLLNEINRIDRKDAAFRRMTGTDTQDDEFWEEEPERDGRHKREDLDYRHTETLSFEDDDYCYYVEATPKKGRRDR